MSELRGHLDITTDGITGTVRIDGTDISSGIRGMTLVLDAGRLPELTVDPLIITSRTRCYCGTVRYRLIPEVHTALVALGWTPPPDDPAGGE